MFSSILIPRTTRLALAATAMLIATFVAVLGTSQSAAAPEAKGNIVRTATDAGQFTTLLTLAKKAGLVGALSSPGPLTVFAPTDAAFRAVPKATLNRLAADRRALRRVLLYHVVKGNVRAAQVASLRSAKTLAGPAVAIRLRGRSVFLNGSTKVVKTDIGATNGTIHVVNKVLLPPSR